MIDACTGRVCSLQRVASFCSQDRLCGAGSRFLNGPLGASCGGDNGSALLLTVSGFSYPAANAVNDGARVGIRLLKDICKDGTFSSQTVLRVARFGTKLWRVVNGELSGVCAHDNSLRCSLAAVWQWIWTKKCPQLMRAQPFHAMEGTPQYLSLGLNHVIKISAEEKEAAELEDALLNPLAQVVEAEIDKQRWRGEMAGQAYKYFKSTKDNLDLTGIGQPLPVVEKDSAWKLGGWIASTAQQRRSQGADGGSAITKIRLMVKSSSTVDNA